MNDIRNTLAMRVKEITGIQREIVDGDLLLDDLGLNSIDFVEIVGLCREYLGSALKVSQLRDCATFGALVAIATSNVVAT